jgi:hypothetical protein
MAFPTPGMISLTTRKAIPATGKLIPTAGKLIPTPGKAIPKTGKVSPTTGMIIPTTRQAIPTTGKAIPTIGMNPLQVPTHLFEHFRASAPPPRRPKDRAVSKLLSSISSAVPNVLKRFRCLKLGRTSCFSATTCTFSASASPPNRYTSSTSIRPQLGWRHAARGSGVEASSTIAAV